MQQNLGYLQIQPDSMKALGEDPNAFKELRQALHDAFSPEDHFEEILVADMAEIRWRRRRLLRAESAILASQRQEWRIQRAWKKASVEMPSPSMGLTSLGPSAENIAQILGYLETVEDRVSSEGFDDEASNMLQSVYGTKPSHAGASLRDLFDRAPKWVRGDPVRHSEKIEPFRRSFLEMLAREIAFYRKLSDLYEGSDGSGSTPTEAHLILSQGDLARVMSCEAALERQFERKLQQLVAWRRSKEHYQSSNA